MDVFPFFLPEAVRVTFPYGSVNGFHVVQVNQPTSI